MRFSLIESQALERLNPVDKILLNAWIQKQKDPRCDNKHRLYYEKTLNKFVCHICKRFQEVETNV